MPPLFAIFSVIKQISLQRDPLLKKLCTSKSLTARRMLIPSILRFMERNKALLTMAQRSYIDVLDKIDVASSEYLGLAGRYIYFSNRWYGEKLKGGEVQWHSELGDLIAEKNCAGRLGRDLARYRSGRRSLSKQAAQECFNASCRCHRELC